jgi:hypothetical protein
MHRISRFLDDPAVHAAFDVKMSSRATFADETGPSLTTASLLAALAGDDEG